MTEHDPSVPIRPSEEGPRFRVDLYDLEAMDRLRIQYKGMRETQEKYRAFKAPDGREQDFDYYYALKMIERLIIYGEVELWAFNRETAEHDDYFRGDKYDLDMKRIHSLDIVEFIPEQPTQSQE